LSLLHNLKTLYRILDKDNEELTPYRSHITHTLESASTLADMIQGRSSALDFKPTNISMMLESHKDSLSNHAAYLEHDFRFMFEPELHGYTIPTLFKLIHELVINELLSVSSIDTKIEIRASIQDTGITLTYQLFNHKILGEAQPNLQQFEGPLNFICDEAQLVIDDDMVLSAHLTCSERVDAQHIPVSYIKNNPEAFHPDKRLALLIDDDPSVIETLSGYLKDKYNVLVAYNGVDGLELMKEYYPNIVVCDIMMPGLSGFEVLQRAKSDATLNMIPILMFSALNDKESRDLAFKLTADDYIDKTASYDEIMNRIETRLSHHQAIFNNVFESFSLVRKSVNVPDDGQLISLVQSNEKAVNEFFVKTIEYLVEHIDEKLDFDMAAYKITGKSRKTFDRLLSTSSNKQISTIKELHNIIIMNFAYQALKSSTTVGQVAERLNIEPAYLPRVFKKNFGITPSERISGKQATQGLFLDIDFSKYFDLISS
jgi:DNA-binding response OmpR family regulator